ncbi:MAG: UDP-glucose/GDP-mannose dehydrogenase family protein [Planctomycetales bacterium]|nr:UDP-glucose/GDP-mannose dehydrogenase family protein [Planctomycetales bacterium]
MKITMIGVGYVGLVTGTCFADSGHDVTCLDIDEAKVLRLRDGEIPIYEPGLSELVARNIAVGRLSFTTDVEEAVGSADVVFLAVGTPSGADGSADLSALWKVVDSIAPYLLDDTIVVTKSTVPVGTNAAVYDRLVALTGRACHVASNPEFLKEGTAIEDFTRPDRVVVGVRAQHDADVLHRLYAPFLRTDRPFLAMSPESAELTKYVANALLATKISFINQMSNLCEHCRADVDDVRKGIGHDERIGFAFLFPGAGYGGSCFPKDVRALVNTFHSHGLESEILDAVDRVNELQKQQLQNKIEGFFDHDLNGRAIAVWGLAFKPKTDDIREAPALVLIDRLLELGADVRVSDPVAMENVFQVFGKRLKYFVNPMDALDDADALAIVTEWSQFRNPDFKEISRRMRDAVIFDGRNLYPHTAIPDTGITYFSMGRPPVISNSSYVRLIA